MRQLKIPESKVSLRKKDLVLTEKSPSLLPAHFQAWNSVDKKRYAVYLYKVLGPTGDNVSTSIQRVSIKSLQYHGKMKLVVQGSSVYQAMFTLNHNLHSIFETDNIVCQQFICNLMWSIYVMCGLLTNKETKFWLHSFSHYRIRQIWAHKNRLIWTQPFSYMC
jgi:hypothetical protein